MKVDVVGSLGAGDIERVSIGVEAIPGVSEYRYASAWPRILGVDYVNIELSAPENVVDAACSILKVASWSNGSFGSRKWDESTTPISKPPEPELRRDPNAINGISRYPVYNCSSLATFSVGDPALDPLGNSNGWEFEPAAKDRTGIVRIVPETIDPAEAKRSDGHWMIGLGKASDVLTGDELPKALKANPAVSLHVHGGDGPLLLSPAETVLDYYSRDVPALVYGAIYVPGS